MFPIKRNKGVIVKIVIVALFCLASSAVVHAQPFNPLGSNNSDPSVSAAQIVLKYCAASEFTLKSHAKLLDAVGLKEEAIAADAHAKNMTAGTLSSKDIEKTKQTITESTEQLQKALANNSLELTKEAKTTFLEGGANLALAALGYVAAAQNVKAYKPSANPMSLTTDAKLAIAIGKNLPGDMSRLKTVIGTVRDYSKAKGIPVSKELEDATAALAKLL